MRARIRYDPITLFGLSTAIVVMYRCTLVTTETVYRLPLVHSITDGPQWTILALLEEWLLWSHEHVSILATEILLRCYYLSAFKYAYYRWLLLSAASIPIPCVTCILVHRFTQPLVQWEMCPVFISKVAWLLAKMYLYTLYQSQEAITWITQLRAFFSI